MSHRLHVLIPAELDAQIGAAAERGHISKREWVRRALQESLQRSGKAGPKSNPVARLAKPHAPTGDIDQMLADVETGRSRRSSHSQEIRTTSPRLIDANASRAAGTSFSRSRSLFVGAHSIRTAIIRHSRFCSKGMFWSTVTTTSKPAASAAASRSPLLRPARPAYRAVWQSWSGTDAGDAHRHTHR
jgi:hypothetical protein